MVAEQTSELATALAAMLSIDAYAVIEPAEDVPGSAGTQSAKVAISPARAAPSWSPMLPAGLYRVKARDSSSDTLVQLRDGDRLALAQSTAGTLDLWPGIQTEFGWCQQRQSGRWTMALVPNASSTSSALRRNLVMSGDPAGGGTDGEPTR